MSRTSPRRAGYTLVVCAVTVTVLSIAVATALPLWSAQIRRDREEELIFRGFQYAEAIRVFHKRYGRYPSRLEELIEVRPRSIRRLWTDPMNEGGGGWGLILESEVGESPRRRRGPGGEPPAPEPPSELDPLPEGEEREEGELEGPQVGPIVGVHSKTDRKAFHVLYGQENSRDWKFTVEHLRVAGAGAGGDPARLPSVPRAAWLGRPFRHGLAPPGMTAPQPPQPPGDQK